MPTVSEKAMAIGTTSSLPKIISHFDFIVYPFCYASRHNKIDVPKKLKRLII
jgi:hypothetical protein